MGLNTSTTKPGYQDTGVFTNDVVFDQTKTNGYWKTNLWDNCAFCFPLFEGEGQTITELISGTTVSPNDLGAITNPEIIQWQQDVYGTGLRTFGSFDDRDGMGIFTFTPDSGVITANMTFVYYGRIFTVPTGFNSSGQPYGFFNQPIGLYHSTGDFELYSLFTSSVANGDPNAPLDNGLTVQIYADVTHYTDLAPAGRLLLISIEFNATTGYATLYINGSVYATYPFGTPTDIGLPDGVFMFGGEQLSAYAFALNTCPGADFHSKLALDPFAPFITYEPYALGEPVSYSMNMRS